jgi:hypothetical protein
MQNHLKTVILSLFVASGLFMAVPALAQTYSPSYYYPQTQYQQPQYSQPQYSYTQPVQNQYYGSCPALSYNLVLGSSDYNTAGQVSALQSFLSSRYGVNLVSGYYTSTTASYVARFQQEMGVYPVTGGVGPLTRAAIQRTCGGYNPNPYPNPYPNQPSTTFRLNRNFSLYSGQLAELSGGTLDVTLNQLISPYTYNSYYYYGNNQLPTAARFTVGLGCRAGTYCIYYPTQSYTLTEGDDVTFQGYDIELVSLTQSRATFKVTNNGSHDNNNGSISVTRPSSSDDVNQGDSLHIRWSVSDEPSNSSVILDLYEQGGSKVGTIAVVDASDTNYTWRVPTYHTYCTQQYPNDLCGVDLDGDYYIRASLVQGNGYNGGATIDSDTSGTFTISR